MSAPFGLGFRFRLLKTYLRGFFLGGVLDFEESGGGKVEHADFRASILGSGQQLP